MSDFDISVSGLDDVSEAVEDLEDDATTEAEWIVGTGVEYSVYLEFGTRNMPPYPFFRPAIREAEANPREFTNSETVDDIRTFVRKLAFALESQMKKNATAERGGGRSPGVDPDHPQVDTGTLRNSIEARRR